MKTSVRENCHSGGERREDVKRAGGGGNIPKGPKALAYRG